MSPRVQIPSLLRRLALALGVAVALSAGVTMSAQIPGRNTNMVSGTEWPGGDPFLQRQNEPSIAASTRNPLHLLGGSNDYRTVDVPGLPDGTETGDAWLGVYKSFDGGQRWSSTLLPGYPQDTSEEGLASPLKGYQAAADPVVRAGTNGLLYYSGLVFDRVENGRSAIFVSRFVDRNNKENGDPVDYLGASLVVASPAGGAFLDKPWMAVDIPRGNAAWCRVGVDPSATPDARGGKVKRHGHRNRGRGRNQPPDDGYQYVAAGAIYVAYSTITGEDATLQSQIFVKRSLDCGVTWSPAMRVSSAADAINQGAALAIDPGTGNVFVAWRRFATATAPDADAVMMARLRINGGSFDAPGRARGLRRMTPVAETLDRIFEHRRRRAGVETVADVSQLDQGTNEFRFRTNAYPTLAVDGTGRVYIAWSERGYAALRSDAVDGDARILVATSTDGSTFTEPVVVDDTEDQPGHQLMPSLTFARGKLMLVYYDLRETRAQVFSRFITDDPAQPSYQNRRHTIDIRAAMGTPGSSPVFAPSVRVSDYLVGYRDGASGLEQLQVNPPNLPMFRLGTAPFIGDYIDIAPAPAFVPAASGGWAYNIAPGADFPVFHAVWTDNRDVRPPFADTNGDGNPWNDYTPPTLPGSSAGGTSLFDPSQTVAVCTAGNAGSRNQNIYTARIGGGLLVGAPGNAKPLSTTVQRGFVVFATNQTTSTRTFRMQVLAQPVGGRASFDQFPLPPYTASSPAPLTVLDVRVPARSTASRTLFVTSTDPKAQIVVSVTEVSGIGGTTVTGGLEGRVVLNPDIENPDIENPDIENPDIENPDIENAEVYNPDIENPDIENPDIENPDIENPDIENPDIENVVVANPDIENPDIENPDIENPDIENPDIENPDIENPDIENGTISDVTWTVSNTGNTTSAFNVNLFLSQATVPGGLTTQLILYKTYKTPVAAPNGCDLRVETRNVLIASVPNPDFVSAGESVPDPNDPSEKNATLWLAPGEIARITLRIYDPDRSDNITYTNADGSIASIDPAFNPRTEVTPGISGQGVDVLDPPGATQPPIVTPTGSNLFFLQHPTTAAPGAPIAPAVTVRAFDNTGAGLSGVLVTMSLVTPGSGILSGGLAMTDVSGVAIFPALSVDTPGVYQLMASAAGPTSIATAVSNPFTITAPAVPATVTLSNFSAIYDGTPKSIGVATVPGGLSVDVTYDGGPAPSAIGAYAVSATVTSPGYVGASTATFKIASTLAGGGGGGGPYQRYCGSGVFANGIGVSPPNESLWSAQLLCSDANHPATFGNTDTPPFNTPSTQMVCPGGQVMVGLSGTSGPISWAPTADFVIAIAPRCQLLSGGAVSDPFAPQPGSAVGTPFSLNCPAGQAVTGVVGGAGSIVDSVALVCAPTSSTFVVSNTTDSGPGSLREAIVQANANPDASTITFNIPGAGAATPAVLTLATELPALTAPVTIDGTTQPGYDGLPVVEVTGSGLPGAPGTGFQVFASNTTIRGLAVTLWPNDGVFLLQGTTNVVIENNTIGVDRAGATRGNFAIGVRVRGTTQTISGNAIGSNGIGVVVEALSTPTTGVTIQNNRIGVAPNGTTARPNNAGVVLYGDNAVAVSGTVIDGNQIAGNAGWGIDIQRSGALLPVSGTVIRGNTIGLDGTGAAMGNASGGITLRDAPDTVIGEPGNGNVIVFNGSVGSAGAGVAVTGAASVGVAIRGNAIGDNIGLGINLAADVDEVTPNDAGDADAGPNGLQNAPVITGAVSAADTTVSGTFASNLLNTGYTFDVYESASCDASGYGEGRTYRGSATVFTDGAGLASWSFDVPGPTTGVLSATATAPDGSTSEFSNCTGTGAIASATPAAIAAGQMIVLRGTGMPATGASGILFNQGGPDLPASYTFTAGSTLVIARSPGGLVPGPATVRSTDGVTTTAPFPITISATPGAPVLANLRSACGGPDITSVTPSQQVFVLADGVDTSNTTFVWTPAAGAPIVTTTDYTTGGPGYVCTATTAPAGLTTGAWTLQIRVQVGFNTSPLSNGIAVTVP
jgi:hypothetical protein